MFPIFPKYRFYHDEIEVKLPRLKETPQAMPQNEYQIALVARISHVGTFSGNSREEAVEEARRELRQGEIENVEIESCIYIDPNPGAGKDGTMSHPLVINRHHDPIGYDVYVGRPSKWGNPFKIGQVYGGIILDRDSVIQQFEDWLTGSDIGRKLLLDIHELRGKTLACWCAPLSCHADILARLANED